MFRLLLYRQWEQDPQNVPGGNEATIFILVNFLWLSIKNKSFDFDISGDKSRGSFPISESILLIY